MLLTCTADRLGRPQGGVKVSNMPLAPGHMLIRSSDGKPASHCSQFRSHSHLILQVDPKFLLRSIRYLINVMCQVLMPS